MYNALFVQPSITRSTLSILAIYLGLDQNRFQNDMLDEKLHHQIEADQEEGYRLGVQATPTLFIDGHQFHGKLTLSRPTPVIRSHISSYRTVVSTVDQANGIVYWSQGDFGY